MTKEESIQHKPLHVLHGLDTIYRKIKDWLQERPIQGDLMATQVVLNMWPFVNMAYPLLEQSLKALVLDVDKAYKPPTDKHSLKAVFGRLDGLDQDITNRMRKGYLAFQSLHSYVGYRTLDDLIDNIDNDYVKWRYFLLDGWKNGRPAKNSVEAMLEVARQTIDVFAGRVATDHGFQPVGYRLEWKVRNTLTVSTHGNYQEGMVDAINAWCKENNGSYLNGVAKILWRERHEGVPVRYQVEALLAGVMENLKNALLADKDYDVRLFLHRATNNPHPIVWDRQQGIFQ